MINSLTANFDDSPSTIDASQTNAVTQTPIKPSFTQSLPFSTPLFSLIVKLSKTFSPIQYKCNKPHSSSGLKNDRALSKIEEIFIKTQPSINLTRICLPFRLFYAAFDKTHSHGRSGGKLYIKTFNQFYYIPHIPSRFSIFIHDNIECQTNKQTNTSVLNLIKFLLLLYHSMKMQPILTIEFLWSLKDPFLLAGKETCIFLSLLMLLATLLSLTLLLIFPINMLFKRYSVIGLLNLAHLNISSLIEVLNTLINK